MIYDMYDIIIGRSPADVEALGTKGTVMLGKLFVTMGQLTTLSNKIHMDVATSHVIFVCGKRGSGKSYTLGVIAEGFALLEEEVKNNLSIILLDTMGIYWTMKYPNHQDEALLKEWGLEGKKFDIKIYTPIKYYDEFKKKGIPTDFAFSINPSEIDQDDWCMAFKQDKYSHVGVLISRVINELKKTKKKYSIKDIIDRIKKDEESLKEDKDAATSMFILADGWGVFSDKSTPIKELAKAGQITVLDVSCYATMPGGWDVKALVVGLISQHLFIQRMSYRKEEEYKAVHSAVHYFSEEEEVKDKMPLVWLVLDEAHEFLPRDLSEANAATMPLVEIMREGRQPGISLVLATQQPGKIHTDVMTQSDIVLSHRITAKVDTEALGALMQTYMRTGLDVALGHLPKVKGSAVLFDDQNERIFPMRIRPRLSWHGGSAPFAIPKKKKEFKI